jgi:diguanylate cyclase (GGDEF)-like protein/PAS domain S-box-containing protein
METQAGFGDRLSEELESLRRQIAQLQAITFEAGSDRRHRAPMLRESTPLPSAPILPPSLKPTPRQPAAIENSDNFRDLFENASDLVYTHDLSGRIRSLNKAAERITGYTQEEAAQMTMADLVAPESLETLQRTLDRHSSGEVPSTCELIIIGRDGRRITLETNTRTVYQEGRPVAVQGIARDISDRKKTESALYQAKQRLEAWVTELEQRTREMSLLNEMGDMLRACLTTEEAYGVTVRVAQQIFPVRTGALFVITSDRNIVEAAASWGNTPLEERVFAPDECWALRRGRVHSVEDTRAGLLCKHLHHPPPQGYLCVPMMAQSEALGVLHLTQPEQGIWSEAKQRLAIAMAEHIAMALSNLKLHETLRNQSIRDPLTKLFNRSFMEESLELELRRAARRHGPLGIITIDVDHFKSFNESFGRDAGDVMIRDIGGLVQACVRKEDIACRLSGQRFAVLLPQGNIEITQHRAETLRELIMNLDVKHRNQPMGRVTASLGVAGFPEHGRTVEALLSASEAALRRSKEVGGNCVVTAK